VHPDASEVAYNGRDDDCSTATPDDDLDGDGFTQEGGGDCNDADETIHPRADETPYDGIDQDCSGSDLDDVDHDLRVAVDAGGDDCDDMRSDVHPGIVEVPHDGVDQNCDGSDFITSSVALASDDGRANPDVAWNGSEFIVVWQDNVATPREIYAQFVAEDGTPRGSPFSVAAVPGIPLRTPAVAASASGYLVAFREENGSSRGPLGAQRLDASGGKLGAPISIGWGDVPDVAHVSGTYMVVWHDWDSTDWDLALSRTVAVDGTLGPSRSVHRSGAITTFWGPRIMSDGTRFLVTFTRRRNPWAPTALQGSFGRFYEADGTASDERFQVSGPAESMEAAFDGTNYLFALSEGGDLFGQFTDDTGTAVFTSTPFMISNAVGTQSEAQITFANGNYTTLFLDSRWTVPSLYTQRVMTDTSLPADSPSFQNDPFFVFSDVPSQVEMAGSATTTLAVWRTSSDIHVAVVP